MLTLKTISEFKG